MNNFSLNLTDYSNEAMQINLNDVIKNVAVQVDQKVFFFLFLMISAYFLKTVILPRSEDGLNDFKSFESLKSTYTLIFNKIYSLLDTFVLGSMVFVLYVCWVQGYFNVVYKGFLIFFGVISGLILLAEGIEYLRQKWA